MNIQPKIEPGSPSTSHIILDRDEDETHLTETVHNFEDKTIPDLVEVLRKTFDSVEAVLVSRDHGLRDQIQLLQQNVEMEKLARLKAEEEVKKRERVCEEGKKLEQRYITLLKELKRTDLAADRETIEVLRKRNIELKEMCVKEKSEVQKYEGLLKEAEIARLVDRDALKEMKKKNIEFECEVKKLEEKRVEDWNELQVLKSKNGELESRVFELKERRVEDLNELQVLKSKNGELESRVLELKEKRVEDGNAVDVLRKVKDELEHQVLELKGKIVEDEKSLNVLKLKNDELEYEVLEFRKLKEKWEKDTNELFGIREKNAELENEVSELKKLKKKWLNDSIALEELRSKVRVMEDDKKSYAAMEIKNGELKESVNNNLATISKLKYVNNTLSTMFYGVLERVTKLEDFIKLLMSVDASGGGNNDGDADIARTQPQNISGMDGQGASSASGRLKVEKEKDIDDMSQGVHEKKTISGIAAKNGHPTPSSSIAVDMSKRKHSIADNETSRSGSSCSDLSYLNNLASKFEVSKAKKKKL